MAERKSVRCAIYTRKSTEYGLEQDFNSLDAQREACEAYVKSQAHEGWRLLPTYYDDGGISGATLDRPALQLLLDDIKARKLDIIVVYKVDRLTRSLADFAKLVELFDSHGVSFVSVTQQFNTTTSMGRLTLNVLLSFAQFEREVTAERIRDKIAASKQKGMWMGGPPPLGYTVLDKKLVVDEAESEQVRFIFQRYLEVDGIRSLKEDLDARGIRTKVRKLSNGKTVGGIPFYVGPIAYLLKNRTYVGETTHAGKVYPGQQAAIIERQLFEAVQAKLAQSAVVRKHQILSSGSILTGQIYDDAGNRMTPTHSQKGPVRYRYYMSAPRTRDQPDKRASLPRIPAIEIENKVAAAVRQRLAESGVASTSGDLGDHQLIEQYVNRVIVSQTIVSIELQSFDDGEGPPKIIEAKLNLKNHQPRKDIILGQVSERDKTIGIRADSRRTLLVSVAKARTWVQELVEGRIGGIEEIAERQGCSARYVRTTLPLAFLAPDIVEAIIANTVPENFRLSALADEVDGSWEEQRRALGL